MDAAGLRPAFLGRMYEKRNNFQGITVNSVRQEFKNWIIIFLYTNLFKLSLFLKRVRREILKSLYEEMHGVFIVFGTSCPDGHAVGVCVIWTVFIVPWCRTRLMPILPVPYQEREELTYVFQIKAFEQH